MVRLMRLPLVLGAVLLLSGPAVAQSGAPVLYGANGAGGNASANLYILSPSTGAILSTVGPIGFAVTGLAVDPTTGVLYGSTGFNDPVAPRSIIRINKTTGAGTLIGPTGNSSVPDLTFTSDGTLYGWLFLDGVRDDLGTINELTGAGSVVGDSGLATTSGEGLAASPSNALYFAGFGTSGALRTVNRTTGVTTNVATLSGSPVAGAVAALAFRPNGTLYGVTLATGPSGGAAHLVTINTTTGAITDVGPTVNKLDAIAFATVTPRLLTVDPAPSADSDGNGVLEPGETGAVRPSWLNATTTAASFDGTASNLTGPPGATYAIQDGAAGYPSIAAGASGDCAGDCYAMSVSAPASRPASHWDATFLETTTAATAPKTWTLHLGDSFTDVPRTELFYRKIETIFHHGITVGCTGTEYCPSDKVPRSQMAIFIARGIRRGAVLPASGSIGGSSYNCAPGGTSLFTDVAPTDIFCRGVHAIAAADVTTGCAPSLYCPGPNVTRAEMAIFMAKAIVAPSGGTAVPLTYGPDPVTGLSYSCNAASPNLHFADVGVGDSFCKHAHYLWARGVISGCSPTQYCPLSEVARDEMAKFLANAFQLELYGP